MAPLRVRNVPATLSAVLCTPARRAYSVRCRQQRVDIREGFMDVETFRGAAFTVEQPLHLRAGSPAQASPLPAMQKWFRYGEGRCSAGDGSEHPDASGYLRQFAGVDLPYELIYPQPAGGGDAVLDFRSWLSDSKDGIRQALAGILSCELPAASAPTDPRLLRFNAPLALLLAALDFNQGREHQLTQLYIAQAQIPELPRELRDDVPPPDLVAGAGRGDIYNSSVWLGLQPTCTPWHRDPNPNLFCQLCGPKTVRLLPPAPGEQIYRDVQSRLSPAGAGGSSRIRGEEMMHGPERALLHDSVWGAGAPLDIQEACLAPGDALFIPKGWWHSVRSAGPDGYLNASVNWWFR